MDDKNGVNWNKLKEQQLEEFAISNDRLREALRALLECSRCKNGCDPDDMTCASNLADRALEGSAEAGQSVNNEGDE